MKLPLIIVSYLPKKRQEKYIKNVWDNRSDASIYAAHKDATNWIRLSKIIRLSQTLANIAADCQGRLDKYILPQVNKRGLKI